MDTQTTRCRIALLGFDTIGSAVARRLTSPRAVPGLELTFIVDRCAAEKRVTLGHARANDGFVADVVWTDRIADVLRSDVEVIVDSTAGPGGSGVAAEWIRAARFAGKSIVSAPAAAGVDAAADAIVADVAAIAGAPGTEQTIYAEAV